MSSIHETRARHIPLSSYHATPSEGSAGPAGAPVDPRPPLDMWSQTSPRAWTVVGHRGDVARQPENTMAAFEQAWHDGAGAIELDARRTRDGVIVISHDPTVDRCTNGTGAIKDLGFAHLESLNAAALDEHARGPARIPTLAEVLNWARGKVQVDIHINNDQHDYPGIEQEIVDVVRSRNSLSNVMLSSFNHAVINQLKRDNPDIRMGMLFDVHPSLEVVKTWVTRGALAGVALGAATLNPLLAVAGLVGGALMGFVLGREKGNAVSLADWRSTPVDVLCPFWANVDRHWVTQAHQAGKTIFPYTVNAPLTGLLMHWAGVDGIQSDNPGRFTRSEGP